MRIVAESAPNVTHYSIAQIDSMEDVREALPQADALNWLFLSTSGVHGSYSTLDDWSDQPIDDHGEEYIPNRITVLIVQPRTVRMIYGDVEVPTQEDVDWLREQVDRTVDAVAKSQEGNRATGQPPPGGEATS